MFRLSLNFEATVDVLKDIPFLFRSTAQLQYVEDSEQVTRST